MGSVGLFRDQYPVVLAQHRFGGKVQGETWTLDSSSHGFKLCL